MCVCVSECLLSYWLNFVFVFVGIFSDSPEGMLGGNCLAGDKCNIANATCNTDRGVCECDQKEFENRQELDCSCKLSRNE